MPLNNVWQQVVNTLENELPSQQYTTWIKPLQLHIEGDEPVVLMGSDEGANATEALLHALGACLNASFIYHATDQGVHVDELQIDLEGQLDLNGFLGLNENVRNGFESICVIFKVKADAPREKIEELCEYAQKRSPVFDMVTHPVPVHVKLE